MRSVQFVQGEGGGARVIPYASRTGTKRNLAALRDAGWRLLVSPAGKWRHEGFRFALDNGAWSAHQQKQTFDGDLFRRCMMLLGPEADWIVLPDIVGGGRDSLRLSLSWCDEVIAANPAVLLPVQDGMTLGEVESALRSTGAGVFLGGSTQWKLATMIEWGCLARNLGCHYHVARVNSQRRIRQAALAGADSFDGSGASRFASAIGVLTAELGQRKIPVRRWLEVRR